MLKGIVTVGGWTMASRIMGFVRDILIAALAGTGPIADAFFIALRVPNLFRRLFGEGRVQCGVRARVLRHLRHRGRRAGP